MLHRDSVQRSKLWHENMLGSALPWQSAMHEGPTQEGAALMCRVVGRRRRVMLTSSLRARERSKMAARRASLSLKMPVGSME